jgi:hypothetical protein
MKTDTQSIERYINDGGAVGDAERALATGNKVASAGISAGVAIANATLATTTATATGTAVAGGAITTAISGAITSTSSALVSAGVASATVPVVGWVVAGVLVASAGIASLASRRRAKFLAKDRGILKKYIDRFSRKSSEWRLRQAKQQIAMIQFLLDRPKTTWNAKRKAKAELKLEALYFIAKQEKLPLLKQQEQVKIMASQQARQKKQLAIAIPIILVLSIGAGFWVRSLKK